MSVNRIERRKRETKRRMMDAARNILQTEGFEHVTIKSIMDQADLGYGTFYGHFENKEAIVWEVFREISDQMVAESEQASAQYPSHSRAYIGWIDYFESIIQFREQFKLMFGPGGNPVLRANYQTYMTEIVLQNLKRGQYQPAPMFEELPLDYLARFVAGTQIQLTDWLLMPDCPYSAREMATLLFRTIYHQAPPDFEPATT